MKLERDTELRCLADPLSGISAGDVERTFVFIVVRGIFLAFQFYVL